MDFCSSESETERTDREFGNDLDNDDISHMLKTILRSLKKKEILEVAEIYKYDLNPVQESLAQITKTELVRRILRSRAFASNPRELMETIEIKCIFKKTKKMKWNVFFLENYPVENDLTHYEIKDRLNHYLGIKNIPRLVFCRIVDGTFFIRVAVKMSTKNKRLSYYRLYCIHVDTLPFIVCSTTKQNTQKDILKALQRTLVCGEITLMGLKGKNPRGLIQLALQKLKTPLQEYEHMIPYLQGYRRKSIDLAKEVYQDLEKEENLINLDEKKMEENEEYLKQAFGELEQPPIDFLQITFESRYFDGKADLGEDIIKCEVQLLGSNVLEGLRKMVRLDMATAPLPKFIENFQFNGANQLILKEQ